MFDSLQEILISVVFFYQCLSHDVCWLECFMVVTVVCGFSRFLVHAYFVQNIHLQKVNYIPPFTTHLLKFKTISKKHHKVDTYSNSCMMVKVIRQVIKVVESIF